MRSAGRFGMAMMVLAFAACSDPSEPPAAPAAITLNTAANVTVRAGSTFPVSVSVTDAKGEAVRDVMVVFELVRQVGGPPFPVARVDTVRTSSNGAAAIDAEAGNAEGFYEIVITVAQAQIAPAVVSVSVTPDSIVRLEFVPDSVAVELGGSVALSVRAFDQFGNEISVVAQFRSLTTDVAEIISEESANARVEGRAVGTGLIIAKHGDLADTARVFVMPPVRSGLALGANHSCLLAPYENGKVYCWGAAPAAGPATDVCGVTPCVRTARLIATEIRFEAIAAGGDQTCGLSEGALYCWGRGPVVPGGESTTPQRVPGNFPFTESFTIGRDHACALTADGAAYCWGDNSRGQLGTGDFVAASTPTAVVSDVGFSQLSAGPQFTCGLTTGATVHCWGANSYGQLGRGFVSESEPVPESMPGMAGIEELGVGAGEHVCVTAAGLHTYCWGRNDSGQLGDGTTTSASTAQFTNLFRGVVTTAAGSCSTEGVSIYCHGKIGEYEYNEDIVVYKGAQAKAGDRHVCAITIQGTESSKWRCWGDNSFGALGDGTTTSSRTPVEVVF